MNTDTKSAGTVEAVRCLDEMIAVINKPHTGRLPKKAIREAQSRREEITPRLIELVQAAAAAVRSGEPLKGNGHLIALFLLTEFRAKEALPAIIEAVSLPGDGPFDLFGDAITENLWNILATLATDSLESIDRLIEDEAVNEYVRWAAVDSFLLLARDGVLTRDEAIECLRGHLRRAMARENVDLVTRVAAELMQFGAYEARDDFLAACRLGLVEECELPPQKFLAAVEQGEAHFERVLQTCEPTGCADTVAELSTWASYQQEPSLSSVPVSQTHTRNAAVDDWSQPESFPSTTIHNTTPRIGRNELCPCGSGKKYKKCCGR